MSETQLGERYFATRHRLTSVMRGIASLAAETHTDITENLPFEEIAAGLGNPFLFVVCGEVNAGKSTMINGLFGRDLCRVNILPETDRVLWYKYGSPPRDNEVTPLLEERHRPIEFLRDFNLVDTPGTNSIVQGHQDITQKFLPTADLLLFVFPVTNPWGAATWNFISDIPRETLQRTVFIIQQADQRDPMDIEVITGHMSDLSMKRIGYVPPIFPISGKLAYQAKKSTPWDTAKLHASNYPALEAFISKSVCQSPARRKLLDGWRRQAADALRAVEDRIEDQTRGISAQGRFIERVEREIDALREGFVSRLPTHLANVAEVFETEGSLVCKKLDQRLGILPSYFRVFVGDRTGHETEALFIERLKTAMEAVAEKDGDGVVENCHSHWQKLGDRVKTEMGITLKASAPIEQTLQNARSHFVTRIGLAATQGIGDLKVRNQLDKDLRRRNIALKSFLVSTLLFTIAGGVSGALGVPWLPYILCGIALLFLIGGTITAWVTRRSITQEFRQRLNDTCEAFASTLHTDYEEALRLVFKEYTATLSDVRSHLAHEKLAIEPRLKRWQELFLTLKTIEQDWSS